MKKCLLIILSLVLVLSLCGCWDNVEIDDAATVLAIGVDLAENDKMDFTIQIVVPRFLQQKGFEKNAVATYTANGRTLQEALVEIQSSTSREIHGGHIQLIVLGCSFAKKGIFNIVDFAERSHIFRVQATVIVAKNVSARDILETKSALEIFPAVHIMNAIKNKSYIGMTKLSSFLDLINDLNTEGKHLVLPTIEKTTDNKPKYVKDLRIGGLAVFDKEKLVFYITDPNAVQGYLWVVDHIKNALLFIPSPDNPSDFFSLDTQRNKTKLDVNIIDSKFVFSVEISEEGNISEQQSTKNFTTPKMMAYLENAKINAIENKIKDIFLLSQKVCRLDFLGFGNIVSQKYPSEWKEIKSEWDEIFSNSTVKIKVYAKIRRSGQIPQPSQSR